MLIINSSYFTGSKMAYTIIKISTFKLSECIDEKMPSKFSHINAKNVYQVRELFDEGYESEPLRILLKEYGYEEKDGKIELTYDMLKKMLKSIWEHQNPQSITSFREAFLQDTENDNEFYTEDVIESCFKKCEEVVIKILNDMVDETVKDTKYICVFDCGEALDLTTL